MINKFGKDKTKYYHYMEGYSVSRNRDDPKRLFIKREEWSSTWHYHWSKIAFRVWDKYFTKRVQFPDDETYTFGRLGDWLLDQGIHHGKVKLFYYNKDQTVEYDHEGR